MSAIDKILHKYNKRLEKNGHEAIRRTNNQWWIEFCQTWEQRHANDYAVLAGGVRPMHERWHSPESAIYIADGEGVFHSLDDVGSEAHRFISRRSREYSKEDPRVVVDKFNASCVTQQEAYQRKFVLAEYLQGPPEQSQIDDLYWNGERQGWSRKMVDKELALQGGRFGAISWPALVRVRRILCDLQKRAEDKEREAKKAAAKARRQTRPTNP